MVSEELRLKFLAIGVDLTRAHPVAVAMFHLVEDLSDLEAIAALRICEQAIVFNSTDDPALLQGVARMKPLLELGDKETRAQVDGEPS